MIDFWYTITMEVNLSKAYQRLQLHEEKKYVCFTILNFTCSNYLFYEFEIKKKTVFFASS